MRVHVWWKSCQSNSSVPRVRHRVSSAPEECGIWQQPVCDGCGRWDYWMPRPAAYPALSGLHGEAAQIACWVCECHLPLPLPRTQTQDMTDCYEKKFVLIFLHQLQTWHNLHLLLHVVLLLSWSCSNRWISPIHWDHSCKPTTCCNSRRMGQTDRQHTIS